MIHSARTVMTPASTNELQAAVREAHVNGAPMLVVGGNTLRGMGSPPERHDITLAMTQLKALRSYEPRDLVVSVEAGMCVRTFSTLLAQQGQFVPLDAPQAQHATVGGTLAAGWLGPRRHTFGRPRDYIIGSRIVLADASIAAAGGMVVKNVTGYDMSRLYVGSFGTLGVLASANFKTLPLATQARAFTARLPEQTRLRAISAVHDMEITPSAALWVHGYKKSIEGEDGDDGRLFVLLEASEALIERATRDLRSTFGRAGIPETTIIDAGARDALQKTIDAYVSNVGERSATYRMMGGADDAEPRLRAAYTSAHESELQGECIFDIMNGDVIFRVSAKDAQAFASRIETFDETLHARVPRAAVIASDAPIRDALNVWGALPDAITKMRALKAAFDPQRIFNRGRFVGGI